MLLSVTITVLARNRPRTAGRALHRDLHYVHAGTGIQVYVPYTIYAHFFLMRELMLGGGVKQVQYSMD